MNNDIMALKKHMPEIDDSIGGYLDFAQMRLKWDHPDNVPVHELSNFVKLCCGKELNKRETNSSWWMRPLRDSQANYTALEAFCEIEIVEKIRSTMDTIRFLNDSGHVQAFLSQYKGTFGSIFVPIHGISFIHEK